MPLTDNLLTLIGLLLPTVASILSYYLYRRQQIKQTAIQAEVAAGRSALDSVVEANKELRAELDRVSDDREKLRAELDWVSDDREKLRAEIQRLEGAIAEQRLYHTAELDRISNQLSNRIKELELEVASLRAENSKLKEQLAIHGT